MCQRAKSPRKVREKVPDPKPPTGAPCQKPSSIIPDCASAGLRPPGLSSGWPMPRFHAALGMASPANSHGVHDMSRQITALTITERADNFMRFPPGGFPDQEKRYSTLVRPYYKFRLKGAGARALIIESTVAHSEKHLSL